MLSTFSSSHHHLRLLFYVWFCGSRVVQPSFGYCLLYPPLVYTQCDSRDYRHNNVVTAGGNDLKQEPKTETRTTDEGIVKTNTWKQNMKTILARRPTGLLMMIIESHDSDAVKHSSSRPRDRDVLTEPLLVGGLVVIIAGQASNGDMLILERKGSDHKSIYKRAIEKPLQTSNGKASTNEQQKPLQPASYYHYPLPPEPSRDHLEKLLPFNHDVFHPALSWHMHCYVPLIVTSK